MNAQRRLFVTGGNGFVGRHLLLRLGPATVSRRVCLIRRPEALDSDIRQLPGLECVTGDLLEPAAYSHALAGCDTVVHLAGLTGKASCDDIFRINRDGTQALVRACVDQKVRNFLFVSSIAAGWLARHYPYADAKREAERQVSQSGLRFTIVRPTPVFGAGSPIWASLARLARLPISPIFGNGSARLQPIDVDDLADCLHDLVVEERFAGETLDLGGPEIVAIEELICRMRHAFGRRPGRVAHVPLRITQGALARMERWFLRFLPFTAGQLSTFGHDGTITPNSFLTPRLPRMKSVSAMIAEAIAREQAA